MKICFTSDGAVDSIRDEEGTVLFVVAKGNGPLAVKMQTKVWELQAKSRYTAAARLSAQVETISGYRAVGAWAEMGA